MDCDETDLKHIHDTEPMAVIDKLRSMRWLKNTYQLSDHERRATNGKKIKSIANQSKINEHAGGSTEVLSTVPSCESSDSNLKDNIVAAECSSNKITQSAIEVITNLQRDMEAVWNKDVNVASTLFPNSQSLVLQRLDEEEMMSMALAESIVTAQLEQFRLDSEKKNVPEAQRSDSDDDTWGMVRRNLPDSPESENNVDENVSSQHPHDNNNNNAKSKAQSVSEPKKCAQKTTAKVGFKKLDEQKVKRLTDKGTTLRDSSVTARRCTKDKDDTQTLNNDTNNTTASNTDAKKSSSAAVPKFVDKFNRLDGYNNRHVFIGKGARAKEQELPKQNFTSPDNDGNKGRPAAEEAEDKTKTVCARLKSSRIESDRKPSDVSVPRKCHNVQITRTSSYNVQYNRNKALNKLQQRYPRSTMKSEQENTNKKYTPVSTTPSATVENNSRQAPPKVTSPRSATYKKPDKVNDAKNGGNENASTEKEVSEVSSSEGASSKVPSKMSVATGSSESVEHTTRSSSSAPHKVCAQSSFSSAKSKIESKIKQDSIYAQRSKKEPSVFRRSTECLDNKHPLSATKSDDHKRCTIDTNASKTYKINQVRLHSADTKVRPQIEATKASASATKAVGDNKINKTDTPNPISSNASDPAKSADCPTSNTNESTPTDKSTNKDAPPQASTNEVKTVVPAAQTASSNNPSNNKLNAINTETKSVKFSDNVQQFSASDYSAPYVSNPPQQSATSTNPFTVNLQSAPNARHGQQQVERHHSKNFFETNAQYGDVPSISVHNINQDLHTLESLQQKGGQMLHSPQSIMPQSIPNTSAASLATGMLNYQHPSMYVNQYNNMHTMSRKTSETANISQNAAVPSTTTYSPENSNLLQNELSNILMHGNQAAVVPPPGFHGSPLAAQQSQWNMALPDMLYFGNVMGGAHPLNMQLQNPRSVCGNDFNSMQQANYMQHPLFYMPPWCVQGWNPLLPYPTPLFQNHQFPNCNTFPNQAMPACSLTEPISCPVSTSTSNNSYKHYHQIQQLDNNPPTFTAPIKLENYVGGMQACASKSNGSKMKDNGMDVQMRAGQYHRTPVRNEYQHCSQEAQVMTPFTYAAPIDSFSRNGQSNNMYSYMQHNYHAQRSAAASNYQKMPEGYPVFNNNQESIGRKDYDVSKGDAECVPPMVSPRDCMYYGVNYSRKNDNIANSAQRSDMKAVYVHAGTSSQQHCVPQYQKSAAYHIPAKDLSSRVTMGRGTRKAMEP